MRDFPLVYILVFISLSVAGQSGKEPNVKLLSWNIFMLPKMAAKVSPSQRAKAIGQLLKTSNYDVVVFQEAFSRKSRRIITANLDSSFPFMAGPANQKFLTFKTNSGIWMLSKFPITSTKSIIYKTYAGMDAFSRKGAMMAEINVGNRKMQVIGTHLQSSGGPNRRRAQCVQLYNELLKPFQKDSVPQIICGDLNIDKYSKDSTYTFMLHALKAKDGSLKGTSNFSFDPPSNDLTEDTIQKSKLIDYILVGGNGAWAKRDNNQIVALRKQWASDHRDLSDHYALEADIQINSKGDSLLTPSDRNEFLANATLLSAKQPTEFYIAQEYQHFNSNGIAVPVVGLSAGVQINQKWNAGLGIFSTLDHSSFKNTARADIGKLQVKLVGVILDYTLFERKNFRVSFPLMIGRGKVVIDSSLIGRNQAGARIVTTEKSVGGTGSFLRPGIDFQYSISKRFIVFMGANALIFTDSDINSNGNAHSLPNQLKTLSFNAGLSVRLFHKSQRL